MPGEEGFGDVIRLDFSGHRILTVLSAILARKRTETSRGLSEASGETASVALSAY